MKRFLTSILLIFLILSFSNIQAADTTNCATSYKEGKTWILYYGTVTFKSDAGTDNTFSQAMWIAESNLEYGGIQVYFTDGTGTEDANGYLEYTNDPDVDGTYFKSGAYTDLDQIQTAVKEDTLGVELGADDPFKRSIWMRLKVDGQTGNPNASVCNFFIFLHKKTNCPMRGVARVKDTS